MSHEAPRLLIAYDGSPSAAAAVRAAARLFGTARADVATVASEPSETAHQGTVQARELGLDADPVTLGPTGRSWAALLEAAHRLGADVLVCGTRGRGVAARAVLGSTSSSLLHHTDLPLLVVPDGDQHFDGPVVAAYDGSDAAGRAIAAAGRLLSGRPAVVVHAWEPMFHRSVAARALATGPVEEVREIVADLQDEFAARAVETTASGVAAARAAGLDAVVDTVELEDAAWQAVATAAKAHGAALIAMGTRGLGATRSVLLGSVSSGLVQNAELPVLVVPGEPTRDAG